MTSFTAATPFPSSQASTVPGGGGGGGSGGGGNGGGGSSTNTNLANSASLYLYTFLATLVLLLSVSGAIVVRSFIIRRRHRRMEEEARRNGTWIAPTAARSSRVDLDKKPELWEAYLRGGGWQRGSFGSGKELDIGANWKSEYSTRDWESIKPIYAGYIEPMTSVSHSDSTPNLTSLSPPISIPIPTPINPSASGRDDEENRRIAEVSTGTTPTPSLFTRARTFLNPNSNVPASSSADNGINSRSISANISMTELSSNSSSTLRVAVLIAMPSPSSHGSSTPLSSSLSSKSQPSTSRPLDLSSISPTTLRDDEEQPLPHIEIGVADVVIGRSVNSSTRDNVLTRREEKAIYSRGSSYAEP